METRAIELPPIQRKKKIYANQVQAWGLPHKKKINPFMGGGGGKSPYSTVHSMSFHSVFWLWPNKTRSQAVPRPPAKNNVSDPRPLIPKREGGGAQNRTVRTLPNTARRRFKLVVAPLGKSQTTINARTFPGPSTIPSQHPRKAKNLDGLSFRDAPLHFAPSLCCFLGDFFYPVNITGPQLR